MDKEELLKMTKEELANKIVAMHDEYEKLALAFNEATIIKNALISQIRLMSINNEQKTR